MKNRILLVDDSITIHRVIDLSLESDKFDVQKTFSYEDAIAVLKKFHPEVVLLDNKLEGVDIKSFINEIKTTYEAKVILLVGAFDNFDESKLSEYGSDDFLFKPFSSQSLEEKLLKFLPESGMEDIVVPLPEEKDAAVEELMSKISEDVGFEDLRKESSDVKIFEDTDIKIDLEESVESESKVTKDESLGETLSENIDDIFAGLEELDASELLEEKKDKEELSLDEIEKDIDSVKVNESDIFNELLQEAEKKDESLKEPELEKTNDLMEDQTKIDEGYDESIILENEIDLKIPDEIGVVEGLKVQEETVGEEVVEEELDLEKVSEDRSVIPTTDVSFSGEVSLADKSETATFQQFIGIDEERIRAIISEMINEDFIKSVIKDVLARNLEKAVWEIVPELAERLIIAEIERIKSMDK